MDTHMKTTIDLPDALLKAAKAVAARDGTTVRELVDAGLRQVLRQRQATVAFVLVDASVGGNGLRPEMRERSWDEIRQLAYGDRA